jgi:hypothetical protein
VSTTESHARALDAGHDAAAAGRWASAAARFADARDAAPTASVEAAAALTNLGHALARAGRWVEAREALRDAADAREALLTVGRVEPGVAARGWADLAALLSAAGPEDAARDALLRARARLGAGDDARLHVALAETAALLGGAPDADDDRSADDDMMWMPDAPAALGTPEPPAYEMPAFELDTLSALDVAVEEAVDVPVELPLLMLDDQTPASDEPEDPAEPRPLDVVVALAATADAPPRAAAADPLAAALDAAIASVPDDATDEEAEVLTPGVDMSELHDVAGRAAERGAARAAAPGRVAAIDAIVELTEAAQQPPAGGFRSLLRRLIGR